MKTGKFLSRYLRAADLKDSGPQTVTVASAAEETVGREDEREEKLVLYLKELDQGLVLNKVNIETLVELFGDETDEWTGKKVELYYDPAVAYGGKRIGGVRIREV